jgi:hypothetical protein
MKFSTYVVLQMTDVVGEYIVVEKDSHDFEGAPELACGPDAAEKSLQAQEQGLSAEMASDFNNSYGTQQEWLQSLNKSLSPIVAAGPDQNGLTAAQVAAQTTTALDTSAASNQNIQRAVGNSFAGRGGGNSTGLISGIQTQAAEEAASQSENQLASTLNQNVWNNQILGNNNWKTALGASEQVAGLEAPGNLGSEASQATGSAYQIASENQQLSDQAINEIAGAGKALAGGVLGGIGNLDTTGGSSAGEQIGNFFSGF